MKSKLLPAKALLIISMIILFDLFFLYYLKYSHQNLGFSDFKFTTFGNLANLAFTAITILGLIIISIRKIKVAHKINYFLVAVLNLLLVIILLLKFLSIPSEEYYFFSLSFVQIIVILLFSLFQFIQLLLLMIIWLIILNVSNLLLLRASVNVFFIAAGLLFLTFIFINTNPIGTTNKPNKNLKADYAVVLGAAVWSENKPSPSLASRVDKAAELYNSGKVSKIQLTGGNAPGELSEAEVSLNYIIGKGIPDKDILIEKNTTSTVEQIKYTKSNLMNETTKQSVIIISDKYHLKRVNEICRFLNLKADFAASDLNLKTDKIIFYQLRECFALMLFWLFAL